MERSLSRDFRILRSSRRMTYWVSQNDSLDITQALMGIIYLNRREYDKAIEAVEKAVSLNPSGADVHAWLANVLSACGRHAEALEAVKRAIRLNPLPPAWYYLQLGRTYCFCGEYDQALICLEKGGGAHLCAAPSGPFRQMSPDPFFVAIAHDHGKPSRGDRHASVSAIGSIRTRTANHRGRRS